MPTKLKYRVFSVPVGDEPDVLQSRLNQLAAMGYRVLQSVGTPHGAFIIMEKEPVVEDDTSDSPGVMPHTAPGSIHRPTL